MVKTLPLFTYDGLVCGVDEVGRGPLAGPVMAAAVIIPEKLIIEGVNDSKKLTAAKREKLFGFISEHCIVALGEASVEEIDQINILHATMLAMQRAVANLNVKPDLALIDGNRAPKLHCKAETIIGGDGKNASIAAASIIAKVTRDKLMCKLAEEFPSYGWDRNAGYGTQEHRDAILRDGATIHHRQSFLGKLLAAA